MAEPVLIGYIFGENLGDMWRPVRSQAVPRNKHTERLQIFIDEDQRPKSVSSVVTAARLWSKKPPTGGTPYTGCRPTGKQGLPGSMYMRPGAGKSLLRVWLGEGCRPTFWLSEQAEPELET